MLVGARLFLIGTFIGDSMICTSCSRNSKYQNGSFAIKNVCLPSLKLYATENLTESCEKDKKRKKKEIRPLKY